jgi:hypothetical protein
MILTALFLPFWAFVLGAVAYVFVFGSYEILALAIFVDSIFGDPGRGVWYAYTLTASIVLLISILVKPYMRFYQ